MSLRRRILGSELRGWTDRRDREPFGLQSAFGGRPALATLGLFFICAAIWPKPVAVGRAVMVAGTHCDDARERAARP
jgi:hypothetical protein